MVDIKIRGFESIRASKYYTRLPKQVQRVLPIYIGCVFIILLLSNAGTVANTAIAAKRGLFHGEPKHPASIIPRKIWQIWKVDPLAFDERDLAVARTWTTKNPGYRYEVLTDMNDLSYVETYYGPHGFNRPDIVETYRSLTARIIKSDLLRYLVMYAEGGLYADIDVEDLKPIERFVPVRYDESEIDMIVGVEIDQPEYKSHPILGKKCESFCQWTFLCKPQLPVMLHLVDSILAWLNDLSRQQNVPISDLTLDFDEVIAGTGPSAFTKVILKEISQRVGHEVTWDNFHALSESTLVGGVLVLTVEAFAAGQGHSDSGNHNSKQALVKHRYHASGWPSKHPRYKHPVYAEVETCNWKKDCVDLWDANVAAFEKLPPEDQQRMIALKELNDATAEMKAAQQAKVDALVNPPWPPQGFPPQVPPQPL